MKRGKDMDIFNERKIRGNKYITYYERDNKIISFKYNLPKKNIFYALLSVLIGILALYLDIHYGFELKKLKVWFAAILVIPGLILTGIGLTGFYIILTFKFEFKNGIFYHRGAFEKLESISVEKLDDVTISKFYTSEKKKYLVVFWNRNGDKAIYLYGNNKFMDDNVFIKTLIDNNIRYEINE